MTTRTLGPFNPQTDRRQDTCTGSSGHTFPSSLVATGPEDQSPEHQTTPGEERRCICCLLQQSHTQDKHEQSRLTF